MKLSLTRSMSCRQKKKVLLLIFSLFLGICVPCCLFRRRKCLIFHQVSVLWFLMQNKSDAALYARTVAANKSFRRIQLLLKQEKSFAGFVLDTFHSVLTLCSHTSTCKDTNTYKETQRYSLRQTNAHTHILTQSPYLWCSFIHSLSHTHFYILTLLYYI